LSLFSRLPITLALTLGCALCMARPLYAVAVQPTGEVRECRTMPPPDPGPDDPKGPRHRSEKSDEYDRQFRRGENAPKQSPGSERDRQFERNGHSAGSGSSKDVKSPGEVKPSVEKSGSSRDQRFERRGGPGSNREHSYSDHSDRETPYHRGRYEDSRPSHTDSGSRHTDSGGRQTDHGGSDTGHGDRGGDDGHRGDQGGKGHSGHSRH
jgi:hypothetical protein